MLGCWCAPNLCHGHTLLGLRNEKAIENVENDEFYPIVPELEQIMAAVAIEENEDKTVNDDQIESKRIKDTGDQETINAAAAEEPTTVERGREYMSNWRSVHIFTYYSKMKLKRYSLQKKRRARMGESDKGNLV